jgi:hypothetical protein
LRCEERPSDICRHRIAVVIRRHTQPVCLRVEDPSVVVQDEDEGILLLNR